MCIAIACIGASHPPRPELIESCRVNPHGFGFGFVIERDGARVLETFRTMDADEAVNKYMDAFTDYELAEEEIIASVFHARILTHGEKTVENCHPFQIGDDPQSCLIHNGVLPTRIEKGDTRSDTNVFASDILPLMGGVEALEKIHLWDVLEEYVGTSKVVVLSARLPYALCILGEHRGHWDKEKDVWYSNSSYKVYEPSHHGQWCRCQTCKPHAPYQTGQVWDTTLGKYVDKVIPALPPATPRNGSNGGPNKRERKRLRRESLARATWSETATLGDTLREIESRYDVFDSADSSKYLCDYCDLAQLRAPDFDWCEQCRACQTCGSVRASYDEVCVCESGDGFLTRDPDATDEFEDERPDISLIEMTVPQLYDFAKELRDHMAREPHDERAVALRVALDEELARRSDLFDANQRFQIAMDREDTSSRTRTITAEEIWETA